MSSIIEPSDDFDFDTLSIGPPTSVGSGGVFMVKLLFRNSPLFIQTPGCISKDGFVRHGKRIHIDMLFDNSDSIFINWIERLENRCINLLYDKRASIFNNDSTISRTDIESAFVSLMKLYKSGRFYDIRASAKDNIRIFNQHRSNKDIETMEDVSASTNMVLILELKGIRITSRSFQIETDVRQAMIVAPDPFEEDCFIRFDPIQKSAIEAKRKSGNGEIQFPEKEQDSRIPLEKNIKPDIDTTDIDMATVDTYKDTVETPMDTSTDITEKPVMDTTEDDIVKDTSDDTLLDTNDNNNITTTEEKEEDDININIEPIMEKEEEIPIQIKQKNKKNKRTPRKKNNTFGEEDGIIDVTNDIFNDDDENLPKNDNNDIQLEEVDILSTLENDEHRKEYDTMKEEVIRMRDDFFRSLKKLHEIKTSYNIDDGDIESILEN